MLIHSETMNERLAHAGEVGGILCQVHVPHSHREGPKAIGVQQSGGWRDASLYLCRARAGLGGAGPGAYLVLEWEEWVARDRRYRGAELGG